MILGEPRHYNGLARKALSFQRRQLFTNLCCVCLCPLLMVVVAAVLGAVLTNLLTKTLPTNDILYCSNVSSMNAIGIPNWVFDETTFPKDSGSLFPGSKQSYVYHVNYANYALRPCSYWFGEAHPFNSIYDPNPNITGNFIRDSTFSSEPIGGWFAAILANNPAIITPESIAVFTNLQQNVWSVIGADPSVSSSDIGVKPKQADLSPLALALLANSTAFVSPTPNAPTGLLGTLPTRYWLSLLTNASVSPVPYYNITTGTSDNDIDDYISLKLNSVIDSIARLDKTALRYGNQSEKNAVYAQAAVLTKNQPHGGIYINKIDNLGMKYSYNFHIGNNIRLRTPSIFPYAGERQLLQQSFLSNAILRNSNVTGLGSAQITAGLRHMPIVKGVDTSQFQIAGLIGVILYPFGISFLLPVFALVLIQEKENRILIMMKMNGMKEKPYYIAHFIVFTALYWISIGVFWISGLVFKLSLFTLTDKSLLFILFFLWGNNLIGLSFLFASFFNRSRFALTIIFLIILCSVIIGLSISRIFSEQLVPSAYFLWPPFAFYKALSDINRAAFLTTLRPYKLSMVRPGDEVFTAIVYLVLESPVVFLLAFYFKYVLPTEFGIRYPWHFPFSIPYARYMKNHRRVEAGDDTVVLLDGDEVIFEDDDVRSERQRVLDKDFVASDHQLVMYNMRKIYEARNGIKPRLAIKDVTFAVEKGITFGLLGPNGAGKSTLISILTGLYEASSGVAKIAGFDIHSDSPEVYKRIGVCVQFDVLWEDLTVGEHLYFYSRLKGVKASDEREAVKQALDEVSLSSFENRLTKGLSGGERRRLSIAMALLGSPEVIFFDEPTTGLDPEVRRLIWDIINSARKGKTIILTTHSMEEAEALCQRIGIMARGTLRCHGSPARLKELYGPGFRVSVNLANAAFTESASKWLESLLPDEHKKIDSFATTVSYEFPAKNGVLAKLFSVIEAEKKERGILDYAIGQTTLEEVFVRLISECDASSDA